MAFQMPNFFRNRLSKPRQFNYQPRYYNADKERLSKREAQIKRQMELDEEAAAAQAQPGYDGSKLRESLTENWAMRHRSKELKKSRQIYLGVAFFLGLVVYLIFFR